MFGKIVGVGIGILAFVGGCVALGSSVEELNKEIEKRGEQRRLARQAMQAEKIEKPA